MVHALSYLPVDKRSVDMHITEYATSCTQLLGISKSVDSLLGTMVNGWKFGNLLVLIERFRKVSGNSLKLVATHLLEYGVKGGDELMMTASIFLVANKKIFGRRCCPQPQPKSFSFNLLLSCGCLPQKGLNLYLYVPIGKLQKGPSPADLVQVGTPTVAQIPGKVRTPKNISYIQNIWKNTPYCPNFSVGGNETYITPLLLVVS